MSESLAMGSVYVTDDTMRRMFGLPEDAEIIDVSIAEDGKFKFTIVSAGEISVQGRQATFKKENRSSLMRKLIVENKFEPQGKEIW